MKIEINTFSRSYHAHIGSDSLKKLSQIISNSDQKYFFVVDKNVFRHHRQTLLKNFPALKQNNNLLVIHSIEKNKTIEQVQKIYLRLLENEFSRNDFMIAVGGGIVGDITGFTASTYLRGINYIHVPTTLLSMVDSSVGGKTGVNFKSRKNLIGCFHQPQSVYIQTDFLKTLPKKEFDSGIGEVFKYAFLGDEQNYSFIQKSILKIRHGNFTSLSNLIKRCIDIKASVVSQDEFEISGIRKILNLGHTFAHAIESDSNYKIKHGEAVIAGVFCAIELSKNLKLLSEVHYNKFKKDFYWLFKDSYFKNVHPQNLIKIMRSDKKSRKGKPGFVLLKGVGEILIDFHVKDSNVIRAIQSVKTG